jgi:hypothetical protein
MSRYSNSGIRENHSKLSHWSKKSIKEILQDPRMSYCLHKLNSPFCGDGIVQEGEVKNGFHLLLAVSCEFVLLHIYKFEFWVYYCHVCASLGLPKNFRPPYHPTSC